MSSLSALQEPIDTELVEFQKRFKLSMKSNVPLLDKITYYIVQRKGKQVRPMFVFLSGKIFSPVREETYVAASLIELLHTATLVHDDIVDDSHIRRGFFSLNAIWKNKIAVLVGDYLFMKGFLIALDHKQYDLIHIVSDAVKQMSEGELLQIEKSRGLNITEEVYFDIVRQKTASLIAAACAAGASSTDASPEDVDKMKQVGTLAGIAFQIKDDLFDYGYNNVGKPTGIDIKEKKLTLPLIHSLSKTSEKEKKEILRIIKKSSHKKKSQRKVIDFVKSSGGMIYAETKMNSYKDRALNLLADFPKNDANTALCALIQYVVDRKS